MSMSNERIYTVAGMTCGHCRAAVTEEVVAVPGVTHVDVDLSTGRLAVVGDGITDEAIAAAVTEAGYTLQS